ncbi:MAG: hypothetical protein ABI131_09245 [Nostocoides sp.]
MGLAKALGAGLPETMALLTLGRLNEETAMADCARTATLALPDGAGRCAAGARTAQAVCPPSEEGGRPGGGRARRCRRDPSQGARHQGAAGHRPAGRDVDHATAAADGGSTTATDGLIGHGPHTMTVRTPTGQAHQTQAPPITGIGTRPPPPDADHHHDDEESAPARWQHHVGEGRPLHPDEQLRYDHLVQLFRSEPPYLDPAELADL